MQNRRLDIGSLFQNNFQSAVIVGDVHQVIESITLHFTESVAGFSIAHADIRIMQHDALLIDTVRELREWVGVMPQYLPQKYLVLGLHSASLASQNALLKTLEEPAGNTSIILVVPDTSVLIPTVLSRAIIFPYSSLASSDIPDTFFVLSPAERLALPFVQKLLRSGEYRPSKAEIRNFCTYLVRGVDMCSYTLEQSKKARGVVAFVTSYIFDQGASVKMLTEYLCLVLPIAQKVRR